MWVAINKENLLFKRLQILTNQRSLIFNVFIQRLFSQIYLCIAAEVNRYSLHIDFCDALFDFYVSVSDLGGSILFMNVLYFNQVKKSCIKLGS